MSPVDRIDSVRRFNRFYTARIGVLNEGLLDSPFSLTEARVLWELANREDESGTTATELGRSLDLDAGYMSRVLKSLRGRGLIDASRSENDARQSHLRLSPAGREALAPLEQRSRDQVQALLSHLDEGQQIQLLDGLQRVRELLDGRPKPVGVVLRQHRPGDLGWVVSRHGALYAREYQWDARFEALVARVVAEFVERFDPRREACWIAERDGVNLGSVCLVAARDEATGEPIEGVAQLRLLLVEPSARGLGLGERLLEECHRFARDAGYRRVRLWTNSLLVAAKRLYTKAGYRLVGTEAFSDFGHDLVGETWELDLVTGSTERRRGD